MTSYQHKRRGKEYGFMTPNFEEFVGLVFDESFDSSGWTVLVETIDQGEFILVNVADPYPDLDRDLRVRFSQLADDELPHLVESLGVPVTRNYEGDRSGLKQNGDLDGTRAVVSFLVPVPKMQQSMQP